MRLARCALVLMVVTALLLAGEATSAVASTSATATPGAQAVSQQASASLAQHPAKRAAKKKAAKKKAAKKKAAKKKYIYRPRDRTMFNYPLSRVLKDRYRIRHQIRMAIQHAPGGSSIRLATFTFDDKLIERDLINAHRRGVSVQVLVARQHAAESASLHRLTAALKRKRNKSAPKSRPSFTRICKNSCRGEHGLLHAKLFMFSSTGAKGHRAHWVTMLGSANLTRFAAVGQWNHMNTLLGMPTYKKFLHLYNQMKRDTAVRHSLSFRTKKVRAWVYPKPHYTLAKDPVVRALHHVDCKWHSKGSKKVHRSVIRIAMYAWFNDRGNALAKVVRQKWQHGCRVYVIYAETNSTVLRTLRSRAGRGPIPVRRSVTLGRAGNILDYNHSKYVSVTGRYAKHSARLVWTGSMNFTDLGVASDELVVRLHGSRIFGAYLRNFNRVWHAPSTKRS